ncbi:MAG TPA: secretin and TonB N-terminal domain-containing protein [Smithella sp.]|nr:secretin and TonB N-terminal domain-containing protein [Smithella sp.]
MKKYLSRIFIVFAIIAWIFTYITGESFAASAEDSNQASDNKTEVSATAATAGTTANASTAASAGNLENVLFAKLPGKERIHLVVSKQSSVEIKSKVNGSYLIKLEDMQVPENLRHSLGEGELNNIISVTPSQQSIEGKQWVYLNISANKIVPYSIRQEGSNVLIDFNVSSLEEKKAGNYPKINAPKKTVAKIEAAGNGDEVAKNETDDATAYNRTVKKGKDRIISLDFQDADIKSVLRLMAEYGDISIVSGDDVKGTVTLTMKNVPWEQALDTILDTNGLAKKQMGNVISVLTLTRKKQDEMDRVLAEKNQRDAEDAQKERDLKRLSEKGLLKQVLIEAKIVEANETFIRNIGVQWGFGNQQKVSGGTYGLGLTGGSSTSVTNPYSQVYPSQIGVTTSAGTSLAMAAVNFPAQVGSPAIGLVFGGATGFLETQLAALETNGNGKIISAPKVVTMEGIKAIIKQGAEVPYTTPASGTSPATVSFKDAMLSLEVTPKITDEGKISMEIKANNDTADYANEVLGNPPINTSQIESKVVVSDGDTVVIGGIMQSDEEKNVTGWPFLQHIPVLGWLFKTEDINNTKKQLLIFVTPKILKGGGFKEASG